MVRDMAAVAGLVLLTIGCGMIYLPLGPIAAGAVLLAFAVAGWFLDDGGPPP